jgi:uncharacterized protein
MNDQLSPHRIQSVSEYVKSHFGRVSEESPDLASTVEYRWLHTLRVTSYGREIAGAEGADVEVVVVACLLHDLAHFEGGEYREHGRLGARMARPFLQEMGYPTETVEAICYAVAAHVDDRADFEHPHTLEADVVSDADNVDRFGPYRLLLQCSDKLDDFEALATYARERLQVLNKYMADSPLATQTGRQMFKAQLEHQIDFFTRLESQYQRTDFPQSKAEK